MSSNRRQQKDPMHRIIPELYRIKCVQGLRYHCKTHDLVICETCFELLKPPNFVPMNNHGFLDGTVEWEHCMYCLSPLIKARPLIDCDKCLVEYFRCAIRFHGLDIAWNRVRLLLYDVNCKTIVWVKLRPRNVNHVEPIHLTCTNSCTF